MNQDEIIEMARHIADTFGTRMCDEDGDTHGEELYAMGIDDIVDTIKLVAEKAHEEFGLPAVGILERTVARAVAKEREACAKFAEDFLTNGRSPLGKSVGNAIRARGEA